MRPDRIILDLTMPVMNGWEFLNVRAGIPEFLRIPVIVCSATGDKTEPLHATQVMRKPIQLEELLRHVERLRSAADWEPSRRCRT